MVQELWDREKIRELTYEYGLAIEAQDADRMTSLFTETGSVDFISLGKGVITGHADLKAFYTATWPLKVKPFFTNHMIRITGDRATGFCSLENRATRGTESLIGAGRVEMFYLVLLTIVSRCIKGFPQFSHFKTIHFFHDNDIGRVAVHQKNGFTVGIVAGGQAPDVLNWHVCYLRF